MIGKIHKADSFKATLNYVALKNDGNKENIVSDKILSNLIASDVDGMAKEFDFIASARELKQPVKHITLSADPNDNITHEKWKEIAKEYIKCMGFENSQYAVYRHNDTNNDHIHIVANRVTIDGGIVSDSWEAYKSIEQIRYIEWGHNLVSFEDRFGEEHHKRKNRKKVISSAEDIIMRKKGTIPDKLMLSQKIENAFKSKSFEEFQAKLDSMGIDVETRISKKTGEISGIKYKFKYQEKWIPGNKLGNQFSFKGIKSLIDKNQEQGRSKGMSF